jgi:ATP-dependent RNA helicase DHX37/DHR1
VCQIHRKLPTGGILVFVTGKQEIVRLVTKLRRTLNPKPKKVSKKRRKGGLDNDDAPQSVALSFRDVQDNGGGDAGFRDMDDDEVDGEVLTGGNEHDAILDSDNDDLDEDEDDDEDDDEDGESLRQPVHVLPLYSMLSADDQAKVFGDVPENHRLIVISTNIAETSVTIPGISYVVDCGRQKCRNYNASTNISTYDIMWISKASADQRAGRAGRTGPGHCYRLFSSSVYARQFEAFAVPEILLKPLEDVVLTMKAMNIPSVAQFPFATPPHPKQLQSALRLLNNIGCITPSEDSHNTKAASFDLTKYDQEAKERALNGGNDNSKDDGRITTLGRAVAKLPLNVRFGKMLLMGLQGQVLDYAIVVVAILSEVSPFVNAHEAKEEEEEDDNDDENNDKKKNNNDDNDDTNQKQNAHQIRNQWTHQEGDVLAALAAVGAYSYAAASAAASAADNNKGGISSSKRGRKNKSNNVTADASDATATAKAFCDDHGLNHVVMERIQKLRQQLARLVKLRLGNIVDVNGGGKLSKSIKSSNHSVAIRTGGISLTMAPPTKLQENLLRQLVLSGLLDNVARLAPVGSLSGEYPLPPRAAYISCNGAVTEPLWIDRHSFMYTRDFRRLSEYVCFDSLVRKVQKGRPGTSGNASMPTTVSFMTTVTPLSPAWLGVLAQDSPLLTTGDALDIPAPKYDTKTHQIMCSVETHYGAHGWNLPPLRVPMVEEVLLSSKSSSNNAAIVEGDQYRWLARWILEGKLLSADNNDNNEELMDCWNDSPSLITKRRNVPIPKVVNLVSALGVHNIDSIPKLQQHWATKDKTFLFRQLKAWTKTESQSYKAKVKQLWIALVEQNMEQWKNRPQQEE